MDEIGQFIKERLKKIGILEHISQIQAVEREVMSRFQTKCKCFYAGGTDGPIFDFDAYVITYIDKNGDIQGVEMTVESY